MALYHMGVIAFAPPEAFVFRGTHLLFAMTLVFLIYPLRTARGRLNPGSEGLAGGGDFALGVVGRLFADYQWLVLRMPYIDDPRPMDVVGAVALVVLILEATRRVIGWALPITAMVFLAWAYVSGSAAPLSIVDQLYLTTGRDLRVDAGGFGWVCGDLRFVWGVHGAVGGGSAVHGHGVSVDGAGGGRTGKGGGGVVVVVRECFGVGGGERDGDGAGDDPVDVAERVHGAVLRPGLRRWRARGGRSCHRSWGRRRS